MPPWKRRPWKELKCYKLNLSKRHWTVHEVMYSSGGSNRINVRERSFAFIPPSSPNNETVKKVRWKINETRCYTTDKVSQAAGMSWSACEEMLRLECEIRRETHCHRVCSAPAHRGQDAKQSQDSHEAGYRWYNQVKSPRKQVMSRIEQIYEHISSRARNLMQNFLTGQYQEKILP